MGKSVMRKLPPVALVFIAVGSGIVIAYWMCLVVFYVRIQARDPIPLWILHGFSYIGEPSYFLGILLLASGCVLLLVSLIHWLYRWLFTPAEKG
jgi:hypothetical protein